MDIAIIGITVVIGVSIYYSNMIKSIYEWYTIKKNTLMILSKMLSSIKEDKNKKYGITVNDSDMSANIIYNHLAKDYIINVPYNKKKILSMLSLYVVLNKNGEEINITQQPGIPYLLTGEQLGGDNIIITNMDSGKIYNYGNDKPPLYGCECV